MSAAASQFMANLTGVKAQLKKMLAAFKKLSGWGVPAAFLSQLFASGNGGLILELASSRRQAQHAASLFGDVQNLSDQLGGKVARNQSGDQIQGVNRRLDAANKHLSEIEKHIKHIKHVGKDVGDAVNGASAAGNRGRVMVA